MNKQTFLQGTLILLAAGIVNRILGFIPRITLPRIIGPEGVGLYQMGYPFLIVVITVINGGIPLAVAKLVAEAETQKNLHKQRRILATALVFCLSFSVLVTFLLVCFTPWIAEVLFTDSRVKWTFYSMFPMISMISVSSVFRGYFQGKHNMIPTAASQILETAIRIVAVLLFSYWMLPYGVEFAAAGAMIGVMVGELGGMLLLLKYDALYKPHDDKPHGNHELKSPKGKLRKWRTTAAEHFGYLKGILHISVPVTGSKLIGSGSYFLESILIVQSLAVAGVATHLATAQYGMLQGMVMPILLLPTALTYSLSVSLVPSLSDAAARKDMLMIHKRLHQSLRLALVTGAPFAVVMYVLAEPLCDVLYGDPEAGKLLKMMAPVAIFLYFQAPLQATLQALNKPGTALLNGFVGAAVKLILITHLASKPQLGILGALLAINANIVLVTLLHFRSVMKLIGFRMQWMDFFKVGVCMAGMGLVCQAAMFGTWADPIFLRFFSAAGAGAVVYLFTCFALRLVDKSDIERIPWIGNRLIRWIP